MPINELTPLVTDFESYFEKGKTNLPKPACSLSSGSYTDYIKHPRFAVSYAAFCNGLETWGEATPIKKYLEEINWENTLLICHNAIFDAAVLAFHYDIRPPHIFCTLSAARALIPGVPHDLGSLEKLLKLGDDKKQLKEALLPNKYWDDLAPEEQTNLAAYAQNDAYKTFKLYKILHPLLPEQEHKRINWIHQNWINPILELNTERLKIAAQKEKEHRTQLVQASGYTQEQLASNPQFCEILQSKGIEIPTKFSEKQGKDIEAISIGDIEFLNLWTKYPEIAHILDARVAVKSTIERSRIKQLQTTADKMNGKLPVAYNYYAAHTGRLGGTNKLNFTNFPRRSEIRKSIEAPPGHVLVVCDSAQIEARTLAWLAEHKKLLEAFKNGEDIYSLFASKKFKRTITKSDKTERHVGKVCILGLGYGMGAFKYQNTMALGAMGGPRLNITNEEAQETVNLYRQEHWPIPQFWRNLQNLLPHMANPKTEPFKFGCLTISHETITRPSGLKLIYPALRQTEESEWIYGINKIKKIYSGKVAENITQALAGDVVAEQKLIINERYRVVMHTYDENVCCVPEEEAENCKAFMLEVMKTPPEWCKDLPLNAEAGYAKEYSK